MPPWLGAVSRNSPVTSLQTKAQASGDDPGPSWPGVQQCPLTNQSNRPWQALGGHVKAPRPSPPFLPFSKPTCVLSACCIPGMVPDLDLTLLASLSSFSQFWSSGLGRSGGCLSATLAMQPWPLKELNSARREEGPGPGAGQQREAFTPRPLEHHIELGDQKVNVVTLLGLEGLCDDASRVPMLLAPQRQPVHF